MNTIECPDHVLRELRRFLAAAPKILDAGNPGRDGTAGPSGERVRRALAEELRPQARMLLSLHIPKTAGLTFSRVLAEVYREDFFRRYWEITNCRGEVVPEFPANARCIHGHLDLEPMLSAYPDAVLVTWVRNPVERVASQYHYWQREPDWRHPLCRALHERRLSLIEFARQEQARNEMCRFFSGREPVDFSFVGVFEELPASMDLFFRKFGVPPTPLTHGHRNPGRNRNDYPLSARERSEIAECNERDWELYWECVQRFNAEREALAA